MNEHDLTNDRTVFGMWIYIMSDCVLFAGLFAVYAVLNGQFFAGPTPGQIFSLNYALAETMVLLTSSFTCGLAVLAANENKKNWVLAMLAVTLLLGATFVGMELYEFHGLIAAGHSWKQSAFLSSFFALVATHGLHVTIGSLWMLCLGIYIYTRGLTVSSKRKLMAFSLFWHFLDIVWICIFTFVYLYGIL